MAKRDEDDPVTGDVQPLPHRAKDGPAEDQAAKDEADAHREYVASGTDTRSPLHVLLDKIDANTLAWGEMHVAALQMLDELESKLNAAEPIPPHYLRRVVDEFRIQLDAEENRASELTSLAASVTT